MKIIARFIVGIFCASTSVNATDLDTEKYDLLEVEGVYFSGFEVSNFQPCHTKERWWLEVIDSELWQVIEKEEQPANNKVYSQVFLKVTAYVTPDQGRVKRPSLSIFGFGHLGVYNREIIVKTVLDSRAPTDVDLKRCTVAADRGYPSEEAW